jgi:acetylornithine/N-succinyldiaminopimelate aminotransferase
MSNAQTSHLLPAYARVDLAFERGEGAWLLATNGERYLDFTSGVAVNALGHAHPHVAQAIAEQAAKLIHVSNLFRIPEGERLAERLCAASGFAEYAVFCNSGAEAMEGAIKCARKYHAVNGAPERVRIIWGSSGITNSFDTLWINAGAARASGKRAEPRKCPP